MSVCRFNKHKICITKISTATTIKSAMCNYNIFFHWQNNLLIQCVSVNITVKKENDLILKYLKQSSLLWLVLLGQHFPISISDCYSVILEQCHLASCWCIHLYHRNQWKLNTLSDLSNRKISNQKPPAKAWLRKFIQKSCSVWTPPVSVSRLSYS